MLCENINLFKISTEPQLGQCHGHQKRQQHPRRRGGRPVTKKFPRSPQKMITGLRRWVKLNSSPPTVPSVAPALVQTGAGRVLSNGIPRRAATAAAPNETLEFI
jgi:hypothetical protein